MEYLSGGRKQKIARQVNRVHRPVGFWTPTIHALLEHLQKQGFNGAPIPYGIDDQGNEHVSFIAGEVSNYPLSPAATSQQALVSAAKLLRRYHDATAGFLNNYSDEFKWMLPIREPAEVICHGDFAPYNVVLQGKEAVAIIDFDTAHPAPRAWDIAYALYRWAPLTDPNNTDGFGQLHEQIARARLFCDAYRLEDRHQLCQQVVLRLQSLVRFMRSEATAGNEAFQANLAAGHDQLYLADIAYLQQNEKAINDGLSNP